MSLAWTAPAVQDVTIDEPPTYAKFEEYPDYLAGTEVEEPQVETEQIP